MIITWLIIIITTIVSLYAFNNRELFYKLSFIPYKIKQGEIYRIFSYGLVHANFTHLFFNMLTLYFFGEVIEKDFRIIWGPTGGSILYIVLYISALFISSLSDLKKYADNYAYVAVGASGAISAVVFAFILLHPWAMLGVFFIIPMPAIIFAVLYLLYSHYMAKRGGDNIGHNAHFWGALYGFIFPIIFKFSLIYLFLRHFF